MQQETNDESWLEQQYQQEISNKMQDLEREYKKIHSGAQAKMWDAFQEAATAIAQLYRERLNGVHSESAQLWLPFQTSAGTVTALYKGSCESLVRFADIAVQYGYQRRSVELSEWARSRKKRLVRREDLIAHIAGKVSPISQNHSRRTTGIFGTQYSTHVANLMSEQHNQQISPANVLVGATIMNSSLANHEHSECQPNTDFHTFKEALARRPRAQELYGFVSNEIDRHSKRSASALEDDMDICHISSKRQRFS